MRERKRERGREGEKQRERKGGRGRERDITPSIQASSARTSISRCV